MAKFDDLEFTIPGHILAEVRAAPHARIVIHASDGTQFLTFSPDAIPDDAVAFERDSRGWPVHRWRGMKW